MSWLDLAVIYLACGAPFAVFRLTERTAKSRLPGLRAVSALLLWPAVLWRHVRNAGADRQRPDNVLDLLRRRIEAELANTCDATGIFHFREVFSRYSGLVAAAASDAEPDNEIYELSRHPSRALANVCLARRQKRVLARHLAHARVEFAEIVAIPNSQLLSDLVLELAEYLDDAVLTLRSEEHTSELQSH